MTNPFESEKRRTLSQMLEEASSAMENRRWQKALAILEHILVVDSEYPGAKWRQAEAQKQRQIEVAYELAYRRIQDDDWSEAIRNLRVVQKQSPDFRNTYVLLRICQRKGAVRAAPQTSSVFVQRVITVGAFATTGAAICLLLFSNGSSILPDSPTAVLARRQSTEMAAVPQLPTIQPTATPASAVPAPGVTNAPNAVPTVNPPIALSTPDTDSGFHVENPTPAPGTLPTLSKLPTLTQTPLPTRTPTRIPTRPPATATRAFNGTAVPASTSDETDTPPAATQAPSSTPPPGPIVITVSSATPAPSATTQNTPAPTRTAAPSGTLEPTDTPEPTNTATPVPATATPVPPTATATALPPPTNTATPRPPTSTPQPTATRVPTAVPVNITATEYRFSPSAFTFQKGTKIRVSLANGGQIDHSFVLRDPLGNVIMRMQLLPQQSDIKEATLNMAGTYAFVCDLSDHVQQGMVGSMTVR